MVQRLKVLQKHLTFFVRNIGKYPNNIEFKYRINFSRGQIMIVTNDDCYSLYFRYFKYKILRELQELLASLVHLKFFINS